MKRFILTILVLIVLAAIIGIASGFINLNTSGELKAPKVNVTAQGGELPKLDLDTKELEVGTTERNVGVPTIGIENSTIRVPTVGVKDEPESNPPPPQPQPR